MLVMPVLLLRLCGLLSLGGVLILRSFCRLFLLFMLYGLCFRRSLLGLFKRRRCYDLRAVGVGELKDLYSCQ